MKKYKLLNWDSHVFKFPVAVILPASLSRESLSGILDALRGDDVHLVYWSPGAEDGGSCEAAEALGGFKTGVKMTYIAELSSLEPELRTASPNVLVWNSNTTIHELTTMTQDGAVQSRFFRDPMIREEYYEAVINKWIAESIENGRVFVRKLRWGIGGFISLNEKKGMGNIDFIVVDEAHRGKGFGSELLSHGHGWFVSKGFKHVQAVTQQENTIACRMYEKFGYQIRTKVSFYHFWL